MPQKVQEYSLAAIFCYLRCSERRGSTILLLFLLSQMPEKARKYDAVAVFAISDA